jgi:plastocyanin
MKKTIVLIVAIIIVAGGGILVATHHSSKKSDSQNMGSMDMSGGSSSASSSQASNTNQVEINNFAFSPANITVKKGTTVTWTNKDSVAHTVVESDSQDGPKSNNLAQGASYTFTYNTAGTFKYKCSIHPDMTGSVTVTE